MLSSKVAKISGATDTVTAGTSPMYMQNEPSAKPNSLLLGKFADT